MAFVPLGLGLLLTAVGDIRIEEDARSAGVMLPALVALVTIMSSTFIVFGILWINSIIMVSGLPRRDHADRSVEFWVSLPTSHTTSLAAPLLMHLLVVPAAALALGVLGGALLSSVTVWRVSGIGAWFDMPWGVMLPAVVSMLLRMLAGLPLATLWLLPLIMLLMLSTAFFRRWGIPLLVAVLGLGNLVLHQAYGITVFSDLLGEMFRQATHALVFVDQAQFQVDGPEGAAAVLQAVPGWALANFGHALANLSSPVLLGGVVFSAACFALLLDWRRRSV
jgi:hypothetical protein